MSVAEMRMLQWMSVNTLKDQIKDENIRGKYQVAPVEDKMSETLLRWFDYVQRRSLDETVRTNDSLEVICISSGKGRLKKPWVETVRNDFKALNLTGKIAPDRTDVRFM